MSIWFNSESSDFNIKQKRRLKSWLKETIELYGYRTGEIHYIFVDKPRILKLNLDYLKHNFYTDIITFEYSVDKKFISGDIFICVPVVMDNAIIYKSSTNEELKRVIVHGILHLIGFSDNSEREKKIMRDKENAALKPVKDLLII
jgi:rRNA maturation RNase YbeY